MKTDVQHDEVVSDSPAPGDAELVERFVAARDQAAFGELVRRHSPVVLGVCRRVLHDSNDIDDAFQATFLVFVRDVKRVRKRTSLSSWLYGVAYRLSLRAARTKQRRRETVLVDNTAVEDDTFGNMARRHDQQRLDDELNALPERYRQPLVMRYLTGKSPSEIARELGTTVGAVEGLLKRGKDELRRKICFTLGATLVAVEASQQSIQAASSEALIESTIQAGLAWNLGPNTPSFDLVSGRAVELAGKEIIAMTVTTKTTVAVGLTIGGLIAGIGGAGLLSGQPGINVEAAGINATSTVLHAAGNQLEQSTFIADPAEKKDEAVAAAAPDDKSKNPEAASKEKIAEVSRKKWDVKAIGPERQRIEAVLSDKSDANFPANPLHDAIEVLKNEQKINILFDKVALDAEGISTKDELSLVISGVRLKTVLRLLLEPNGLDYLVKDEYLLITTETVANKTLETRVYKTDRLNNLGAGALEEIVTAVVAPDHWRRNRGGMMAYAGNAAADDTVKPNGTVKAPSNRTDAHVESDKGTISSSEDSLVIRTTQRIHQEIAELFDQLEQQQKQANQKAVDDKPQQAPEPSALGGNAF